MDSTTYNDFCFTATPNKRKQPEERDDDIIVTPSSSYDSDSDDSARDASSILSTPCYGSPLKRRKISMDGEDLSRFSPPPFPRFKYGLASPSSYRDNERSQSFVCGRPVLDIFESSNNSRSRSEQPQNDLSFLAVPTPPSHTSAATIPSFDLSPRTTLAPRFPVLKMDSHRLFETKDAKSSIRMLPLLRMRPTKPQQLRLGKKQLVEELSLPTLADVTLQELNVMAS